MANNTRSHKGTFYVKSRSKTKIASDGNQNAIWAKLIPSNMIISKYWVNGTIRSQDTITAANLSPMEINLSGFLSNIPITGSTYGGGEVAKIDVSDPLTTALDSLGCLPSSASPYIQETGDDIDIAQGWSYARYWQDRRFFDREKTLSFPKNAIMVGSSNGGEYKLFDQISTNGTKLGQNSDYKQPRMLSFIFTADNQLTSTLTTDSTMMIGAGPNDADIDIAEWDRQAQTVFDPMFLNPYDKSESAFNPYFETLGLYDEGSIGSDAAANTSSNVNLLTGDPSSQDEVWSVQRWMRNGYYNDADITNDSAPDFYIDLQVTLQCQMYIPGHRKTVTLP